MFYLKKKRKERIVGCFPVQKNPLKYIQNNTFAKKAGLMTELWGALRHKDYLFVNINQPSSA